MSSVPRKLGYALVGDMVGSRLVVDHEEMRRQVAAALELMNRRFANVLWAPLMLTKGIDEFSGVASSPEEVFELLCQLNVEVHPRSFRLGAAWGETIDLSRRRLASSMEGSAFHRAAVALERARTEHLPIALGVCAGDQCGLLLQAVEAMASLDAALRSKWTPAVVKVARDLIQARERRPTQTKIARRTHRSQQAISQTVLRGRFKELARGGAAIRNLLVEIHRLAQHAPDC
jgi:hypothetical protein